MIAATERPLWAARKYRAKRICQANSGNSHKWESQPLFWDFSLVGIFCSLLASMRKHGIIEKNSKLGNKTHILIFENHPNFRSGARGVRP